MKCKLQELKELQELEKVNEFIRCFFSIQDSYDISEGWCYYWAIEFHKRYGGRLCTVKGHHAFNKLNGKYYDSETHRGVNDWRKLHYFKISSLRGFPIKEKCVIMSPEKFKEHWGILSWR